MINGWVTAAALLASVGAAHAQAANKLSDAGRGVFRAFPHATSYRSIVKDVDQHARREVEQSLPFKVHFNELGPHALYVPFRGPSPIGLLYVRTEDGGWGFSEITWSLSLDLRIVGFRFVRARNPHRFALQRSPFSRSLVGLDYQGLLRLLDKDGKLVVKPNDIPRGSEKLAIALVRSAMKTMLVTRTVWRSDLDRLQKLALGFETFEGARIVVPMSIPPSRLQRLERVRSVQAVRVFGTARTNFGFAAQTVSENAETTVTLRWALTPELEVLRVSPVDRRDDAKLRAACTELAGRSLTDPGRGAVAEVARELGRLLHKPSPRRGEGK
jgi:hypothetical protein